MALMHYLDQWEATDGSSSACPLCELWRQPNGWRQALLIAARLAWESVGGPGWRQRLLPPHPPIRAVEMEREPASDEEARQIEEALEFGILLGFSLARTGPAGVETLERWTQLALAYMTEASKPEA